MTLRELADLVADIEARRATGQTPEQRAARYDADVNTLLVALTTACRTHREAMATVTAQAQAAAVTQAGTLSDVIQMGTRIAALEAENRQLRAAQGFREN